MIDIFIYSIPVLFALFSLQSQRKNRYFPNGFLVSFLTGLCAFCAMRFLGEYLHLYLPANLLTVSVSALGGLPGVILLLIGKIVFGY